MGGDIFRRKHVRVGAKQGGNRLHECEIPLITGKYLHENEEDGDRLRERQCAPHMAKGDEIDCITTNSGDLSQR